MAELLEKAVDVSSGRTPILTITEQAALVGRKVGVRSATCLVHVRAWCQLTTGANTTAIEARIRREGGPGGGFVSLVVVMPLAAAAGGNENVIAEAVERLPAMESVQYIFTVKQVGATTNGEILQAVMAVEVLSG